MHVAFYEGVDPHHVVPRLVEKMYTQKQRGVLWVPDADMYQRLNDVLWTFSKISFIPHGGKSDGVAPEDQPFWMTTVLENPNDARVLVTVGAPCVEVESVKKLGFDRVVDVCAQANPVAQEQYALYQSANVDLQRWVHTASGWQNQANQPAAA